MHAEDVRSGRRRTLAALGALALAPAVRLRARRRDDVSEEAP